MWPEGRTEGQTERWKDRQTDRYDEVNSRFNNFAKAPKKRHGFRAVKINHEEVTEFVACRLQLSLG